MRHWAENKESKACAWKKVFQADDTASANSLEKGSMFACSKTARRPVWNKDRRERLTGDRELSGRTMLIFVEFWPLLHWKPMDGFKWWGALIWFLQQSFWLLLRDRGLVNWVSYLLLCYKLPQNSNFKQYTLAIIVSMGQECGHDVAAWRSHNAAVKAWAGASVISRSTAAGLPPDALGGCQQSSVPQGLLDWGLGSFLADGQTPSSVPRTAVLSIPAGKHEEPARETRSLTREISVFRNLISEVTSYHLLCVVHSE